MRTQGALLVVGLTLVASLAACSDDSTPSSAPSVAASPSVSAVALVARDCPADTPKASTLGMVLAKGTPESVTFCPPSTDAGTRPKGVSLDPARTMTLLTDTATAPSMFPFYCPGPAQRGSAGLLLTYPATESRYVAISPGSCASLEDEDGSGNYLLKDDIEWLVRTAGLDWLGEDGVQETSPPPPTVCPTSPRGPTPLAPVLAKGVATKVVSCWYNYEDPGTVKPGVIEHPLDPLTVDAKLRAAAVATQPKDPVCTQELRMPVWIGLAYADGSRATVMINPSGCWAIVQGKDYVSEAPDRRPLYLPDRTILGD